MCGSCACDNVGLKKELERSQEQTHMLRSSETDVINLKSSNIISSVPRSNSHHRSLTSPTPCSRRIIFPSLYEGPKQQTLLPNHTPDHSKDYQPAAAVALKDTRAEPHARIKSLDGISIPLPRVPVGSVKSYGEKETKLECWSPPSRSIEQKPTAQDPPPKREQASLVSSPPNLTSSLEATPRPRSRSVILGDVLRHRTYYPAATIPTPVNHSKKKSPSDAKSPEPLISILRRRVPLIPAPPLSPLLPPSTTITAMSRRESDPTMTVSSPISSSPTHRLSKSLSIPPSTVPTLASPASIMSLHSQHDYHKIGRCDEEQNDGSSSSSIGESECDIVRIVDFPKLLPRSEQCTLRKIQSDTIVMTNIQDEDVRRLRRESVTTTKTKCQEKPTGGGSDRCSSPSRAVSRHASLESLRTNKRVFFDPHITVFEFGIAEYERKGGEKWWGEEELAQFKQEAIQRIRLRTSKIIPTGTGRSMALPTKKGGSAATTAGISFNHPALSCEDEVDSECKKTSCTTRESMLNSCLTKEIRNILVVDPHEIFLALFTKSFRFMFPHALVATARSAEEALTRIRAAQCAFPQSDGGSMHGFDIIIIEEKLLPVHQRRNSNNNSFHSSARMTHHRASSTQSAGDDSIQRRCGVSSGSGLIQLLIESENKVGPSTTFNTLDSGNHDISEIRSRFSLFVGVSAHLSEYGEKLEKAGADCVWGKPPPEMNYNLRNDLLKKLMKKRKTHSNWDMFEL